MPTITVEVSELVLALRKAYKEQEHTQESFADALDVGRQRAVNWIKGHNDIDMSRTLQLRIALLLGITPAEVLRLHGFDVSDEVVDEEQVANDSGPYGGRVGERTYNVVELDAHGTVHVGPWDDGPARRAAA